MDPLRVAAAAEAATGLALTLVPQMVVQLLFGTHGGRCRRGRGPGCRGGPAGAGDRLLARGRRQWSRARTPRDVGLQHAGHDLLRCARGGRRAPRRAAVACGRRPSGAQRAAGNRAGQTASRGAVKLLKDIYSSYLRFPSCAFAAARRSC